MFCTTDEGIVNKDGATDDEDNDDDDLDFQFDDIDYLDGLDNTEGNILINLGVKWEVDYLPLTNHSGLSCNSCSGDSPFRVLS